MKKAILAENPPRRQGKGRKYPEGATCSVGGCEDRPRRQWMCQKHWGRWFRHGDPNVAKKPWSLTEKNPFCSWGHDKRDVGVTNQGACRECVKRHGREQHRRRERREKPIPNLRAVRKQFGLSQKRFAAECGLHSNTICDLERGYHRAARPATQEKVIAAVARLVAERRKKALVATELIAA